MTDAGYCWHCDEQIEGCLKAASTAGKPSIRSYFLMLADKWTRLARDLEGQQTCGQGCPLRKACGRERAPKAAAEATPDISAVA